MTVSSGGFLIVRVEVDLMDDVDEEYSSVSDALTISDSGFIHESVGDERMYGLVISCFEVVVINLPLPCKKTVEDSSTR